MANLNSTERVRIPLLRTLFFEKQRNLKEELTRQKNDAKETKQPQKRGRKQEKLKRDKGTVESRNNKCCQGLCFHRLLQFLVLFFSVAALALVILMVLGILGPDRCSCNQKGELTVLLVGFL